MDLFRDTNFDFMRYRKFWIVVSFVVIAAGIFAIFVHGKLNIGIDFAGGTQLTLKFQQPPDVDELRDLVAQAGFEDAQLQRFGEQGDNEVMIRVPLDDDEAATTEEGTPAAGAAPSSRDVLIQALHDRYDAGGSGTDLNQAGVNELTELLVAADPEQLGGGAPGEVESSAADQVRDHYEAIAESILDQRREVGIFTSYDQVRTVPGVAPETAGALQDQTYLSQFSILGVETVGPTIGKELRTRGILAVVLSMLGMLVYIWLRFELRYGIGALMATVHDVLVCLGLYAWAGFEFNLTTIAAFLTLVGYSVNDTVVVFDRVRENLAKHKRRSLLDIMNMSLNQTLSRTVLTSGTTLLAVGTLLAIGGDVLRGFAFVLTIGIVVGTYSSIYIASPFALLWERVMHSRGESKRAQPSTTRAA
jgi:preprotein translocase subunit SecF